MAILVILRHPGAPVQYWISTSLLDLTRARKHHRQSFPTTRSCVRNLKAVQHALYLEPSLNDLGSRDEHHDPVPA